MTTRSVGIRALRSAVLAAPLLFWAAATPAEDTSGAAPPQSGCPYGAMGPGMMGGGMMGGGMMGGGYGAGPGGGMMGGGMMGMGALYQLNLSDDQRSKLNKLQDEHRKKDWEIAGKIQDEQAKLRDLYDDEPLDAKKIGAVHANIAKLQQQAVEANVDLWNRSQALLTKEQREQLKQWRRGGWGQGGGPGPGPGPGGPRGMMGR